MRRTRANETDGDQFEMIAFPVSKEQPAAADLRLGVKVYGLDVVGGSAQNSYPV